MGDNDAKIESAFTAYFRGFVLGATMGEMSREEWGALSLLDKMALAVGVGDGRTKEQPDRGPNVMKRVMSLSQQPD